MSDDEINKLILRTNKEELIKLVEVAKEARINDLEDQIINHLQNSNK